MELVKPGFLCLSSVDVLVSSNISVSEVVAHVDSLMADERWAHTVVFLLWGVFDFNLSPFPMSG